jgi:hypothetical protein
MPSGVFALTLMLSAGVFSRAASRTFRRGTKGTMRGSFRISVESTLQMT